MLPSVRAVPCSGCACAQNHPPLRLPETLVRLDAPHGANLLVYVVRGGSFDLESTV